MTCFLEDAMRQTSVWLVLAARLQVGIRATQQCQFPEGEERHEDDNANAVENDAMD